MPTPSCPTVTPPVANRQQQAQSVRDQSDALANRPIPPHVNNCEESDYPYVFNYSKALKHDALGDPDHPSYQSLISALQAKTHAAFESIADGPGPKRLTNPQAGLQFQLEGYDPEALTMPPAPRNDRARAAAEMGELYWMALARDVAFIDYDAQAAISGSVIQRAARSLSSPWFGGEFTEFAGPKVGGRVTAKTLFRGIYPGELTGPYVSQYLLKGNAFPKAPAGQGQSDRDGYLTYGAQVIDQRQRTVQPGINYLTGFSTWLQAQEGQDFRGQDQADPTRRFIRSLRDGTAYVHIDVVIDAWYNAALYLLYEPTGNQLTAAVGAVVMRDREFPFDQGNPYNVSTKQEGFVTLGPLQAIQLVTDVITRAGAAVWFQKWFVHRRLRPEEMGGRIHNHLRNARYYPIHYQILESLRRGLLSNYFNANTGWLLPQAYPEGAPTHPAYGAGHATISGACATILKAYFNEDTAIENPLQSAADGLSLVDYTGTDRACMTVGSELNKLAGNIAIFRNAAGVHWRTDYDQSLLLGEQVAIELLREISLTMNEPEYFLLTKFNGQRIRIQNGQIYTSWWWYRPSACSIIRYPHAQLPYSDDVLLKYAYAGAPYDQGLANPEYEKQSGSTATTYKDPTFESAKASYDAGAGSTQVAAAASSTAVAAESTPVDGQTSPDGSIYDSSLDLPEAQDAAADEAFTAPQEAQDEAEYRAEASGAVKPPA
ncbi:MAG: vanadium-dependent haloperoxidase [Longimicrobiaceae bacterium]